VILTLDKIRKTFIGLTEDVIKKFYKHYQENPKHFYPHSRHWKDIVDDREKYMMYEVNKLVSTMPSYDSNNGIIQIHFVSIDETNYFMVRNYFTMALFDLSDNACHVYHKAEWKTTGIYIWFNINNGYGWNGHPTNSLYRNDYKPTKHDLELIYQMEEFKYIDFTKLEYVNLYPLMNNRLNKEHLWQIEMLIKTGYMRLATELASSYENIDFKVFREYQDFFKLRGKGLWHYHQIMKLREKGFYNPEFMFLDTYESYYHAFWIPFLDEHPEIKRHKFIKYIKGRKSSNTIFETDFLSVYKMYLKYIDRLGLDFSRDKYVFPEDLEEEFKEVLLVMDFTQYPPQDYKNALLMWQSKLNINDMDPRYVAEVINFGIQKQRDEEERKRIIEWQRKTEEEKKKMLKIIFEANKHFNLELDDDFVLVAPKSSDELYIEGKTLNHCVFQYLDSIAKKDKAIFFVRKKKYIEKPFYTVEVRNGHVVQCRSTNNLDPANKASYFTHWINEHIDIIKGKTEMAII